MANRTIDTLTTQIAGVLNKTNLASVIPDFITNGEAVLFRRLKVRRQDRSVTYDIDSDTLATPSDFREVLSFTLTDPVRRIEYVTPDAFDSLDLGTGEPRFYTIVGTQFLLAPTPDTAYPARIRYRQNLCPLSATNPTNWLLCEHPDAYLYAALAESAPYLRDDERLPMWEARRDRIIAEINAIEPRPTTRLRMDDMATHVGHHDIYRG